MSISKEPFLIFTTPLKCSNFASNHLLLMHSSLCRLVIQQASFCRPLPDFYLPVRTNVFASKDRQQQPHEPASYVLSLCLCFLHSFSLYPSSSLFFSICPCWQTNLDVIYQEDLSSDEVGQTWMPPSFPLHYTSTALAWFFLFDPNSGSCVDAHSRDAPRSARPRATSGSLFLSAWLSSGWLLLQTRKSAKEGVGFNRHACTNCVCMCLCSLWHH